MAYVQTAYDPNAYTRDLSAALLPDQYAASTRGGGHSMVGEGNASPDHAVGHRHAGNVERRAENNATRAARRERRASADVARGDYPRNRRRQAVQRTMDELLSILGQHGQTDPGAMNTQLTDISRGAEAGQNNLDEYLASQGLGGSGVGIATHAAIGAAGESQRSRAIADENARAEERRRQDLLLTLQLILNPRITRRGQNMAARRQGGGANWMGALGNILGGLGSGGGNNGGGNSASTGGTDVGGTDASGDSGYSDYGSPSDTGGTPDSGGYGNRNS